MSDKINLKRDPEVAERMRNEFNANEPALLERLRGEMEANPRQFLEATFGTAYNFVPYPDFDNIGPPAGMEYKARTQVALQGLTSLLKSHPALNEGKTVLLVSDSEALLLSEALSALRAKKEEALAVVTAEPSYRNAGLDAKAFGIPAIAELIRKVNGDEDPAPAPPAASRPTLPAEAFAPATPRVPVAAVPELSLEGDLVEVPGGEMKVWHVRPGISDRFGVVEAQYGGATPEGAALLASPQLLAQLQQQMWDELTFISFKDGKYGVLFETEVPVQGDPIMDDAQNLPARQAVVDAQRAHLAVLAKDFPQVDFCLVPHKHAVEGRPGIWAFVPDGALDAAQREALGQRLLSDDALVCGTTVEANIGGVVMPYGWAIETNLSDRWGGLNDAPSYRWRKPGLAVLERDSDLLTQLQGMMHGESELTFIVRKEGNFGILCEVEFPTQESESDGTLDVLPEAEVRNSLRGHLGALSAEFPQVEFCLPDPISGDICDGRQALWAFVDAKKHTPELMDTLCDRLQAIAYGKVAEHTASAAP
ncbi:hypothetical protein LJR168_003760 [Pseudoxanthomonas sp. LjRoot168]|uniref:hypothetical protein n=1 Tax=unclassified Pseudoxanthomonas TaxID=2645906 RepID=UPI003ECE74DA